ncbi:uncharacterized protein MELLADRAFT_33547 [Melampsora larici-populina 98AG31]|uniref:Uncharacterized protein n=1 Tax=Melampsora larici-populina (strain 98AG31 / pathotype 3-4-7) TaxID=747676 RepID=F4R8S3_MELLP|nr:uncharacterized protein MELLADRAFT_33547 [Melampsora larici-populina 98AG31]EGG11276.1 hypothetical protein MELLADRAFT_33547 [Melampsora larici-populina 98AG31]
METAPKSMMDLPAIREFDAFPKTIPTYKERSSRGGILTIVVGFLIMILIWHELREYLFGAATYSFSVDNTVGHDLGLNFDVTINMPCHYLSIDVRDAVGDRMHISDEFKKEGTEFSIGQAARLETNNDAGISASKMVRDAQGGWTRPTFKKTKPLIPEGPACRIFGSTHVKKVTGNLHITTLGHGYLSWEHTDHQLMNLTHVISEFSFGEFFPNMVQPLDNSVEITDKPFHIFQYFISVVPTTYINSGGRQVFTNQYSVTDMSRSTEHGRGVPGIFFKYDIEPMYLTIRERTTTLVQFLVRLAGIVGGIVVCTGWAYRGIDYAASRVMPKLGKETSHGYSDLDSGLPHVSPTRTATRRFYT